VDRPGGFTSQLPKPSFEAHPNTSGQYNVVGTDMYGCINTSSTVVSIFANPLAAVNGNHDICEGDSVHLSASAGILIYGHQLPVYLPPMLPAPLPARLKLHYIQ